MKFTYKHTIRASYFGYITQAIVNNLAPLLFIIFTREFGISLGKITLLITINFGTQLIVDSIAALFVDRIGYRVSIIAAHVFSVLGLVGLSVFPFVLSDGYLGLLLAVILYAIGGGLLEVLVSPIVEACPTDNKAAVMSLLHSFYCWGVVAVVLISTLFLRFVGEENWRVLPIVWALVPLVNAIIFALVPIAKLNEDDEGMSIKELFSTKIFWLFFVLMIASGASEQAMSQWASAFAEMGLNVSKTIGDIMGPCMFAILMGCARTFYGKYSEKVKLINFILGSAGLCIVTYIVASLVDNAVISLIACAVCGLSVGIMWPGVFSMAAGTLKRGGTAMFAILALAGDVGCSAGPTVVGFVSGAFGDDFKKGLLVGLIFPVVMLFGGLVYKRWKRRMK